MENILFKEGISEADQNKVLNSPKFTNWIANIPEKINVQEIKVINFVENEEVLDKIYVHVTFEEKEIVKQEEFVISGGKMLLFPVLIEQETDTKFVLCERDRPSLFSKEIFRLMQFDINQSEISSKTIRKINADIQGVNLKLTFNELLHLNGGFISPKDTDRNVNIFLYEKVVPAQLIQDLMNFYQQDPSAKIGIFRVNDIKKKFNSVEAQLGLSSFLQLRRPGINAVESVKLTSAEIDTVDSIKSAIRDNRVLSLYQPIINNHSEQVVRYESLMRLIDKEENYVTPDKFLDVSIKSKLYPNLTNIVINKAVKVLETDYFSLVINLNSVDLNSNAIKDKIYSLLELGTNKKNGNIIFELNEDREFKDYEAVKVFVKKVKNFGAKIGIEDYGLSTRGKKKMIDLSPDLINIRKELMLDITSRGAQKEILEIVMFAKAHGIETVAGFVENEEAFRIVKNIGVDFSQGYFFGKPDQLPL